MLKHRNLVILIKSSPRNNYYNPFSSQKVSKDAKIRNRCNQVPHLTQDTNGKVTNSQLDTTNESQEVSPFPAGDHKAQINRHVQKHNKHKTEKNDPQKKYRLGSVSKNILLEGFKGTATLMISMLLLLYFQEDFKGTATLMMSMLLLLYFQEELYEP